MNASVTQQPYPVPASAEEHIIDIQNLHKHFGTNEVLKGVNLHLSRGENIAIMGHSGCGKSILAKCIIGLVKADEGHLFVFGKDVAQANRTELNAIRSRIGFLFQSNALYDSMNIYDNLAFTLIRREKHMSGKEITRLIDESLENVGLPGIKQRMPAELSGGMKKRVALARVLILKPDLILYDEPTTGLDPVTAREMCRLILDMQKLYQASALIISHDLQCLRITANRIIALIDGICYAEGTYEELKTHADPKVSNFFI